MGNVLFIKTWRSLPDSYDYAGTVLHEVGNDGEIGSGTIIAESTCENNGSQCAGGSTLRKLGIIFMNRIMKILIPKEHGSWAILLIPYFIGVAISGGFSSRTIVGLIGILFLFFSRQPLLSLIKNRHDNRFSNRGLWLNFLIPFIAGLGAFSWLVLKYQLWQWWIIGLPGVMLFACYILLFYNRKDRSVIGEFIGILILTLSSSTAIYLAQGQFTSRTLLLWLVNGLYFGASVFYVKTQIKKQIFRRKNINHKSNFSMAKNCLAYLAILLLIIGIFIFANWLPGLILLAFIPMIVHTLWKILIIDNELKIIREGWIQVVLSISFAILVIISF